MIEMFPGDADAAKAERDRAAAAAAELDAQRRRLEADYTPRTVASPLVAEVLPLCQPKPGHPLRVLDIGAGAGVFSSEVRRLCDAQGVPVHITAVEINPSERVYLDRYCDETIIGAWQAALGLVWDGRVWVPTGPTTPSYDLILGNPPFSQSRAATRPEWPAASGRATKTGKPTLTKSEKRRRAELREIAKRDLGYPELAEYDPDGSMPAMCRRVSPVVALYVTQQCYTKTASGYFTRRAYTPEFAFDVPSSVGHRGRGVGQDDKPYTMFVWRGRHKHPFTKTKMIDIISDRNWDHRPGAEPPEWLDAHGIPRVIGA